MAPRPGPKFEQPFAWRSSRWIVLFVVILGIAVLFSSRLGAQQAGNAEGATSTDPLAILASLGRNASASPIRQRAALRLFHSSEYSFQLTGLLSTKARGAVGKIAPNSVGFLFGMRFHLNPWEAFEVEFGSTNKPTDGLTPASVVATAGSAVAPVAEMRRVTLNEVVTANAAEHVQPFLLAGGGVAEFQPASQVATALHAQVRGIGVIGVGLNVRFLHMGIRAEVEGLFYKTPDYHNPALQAKWTHIAQPSSGVIFTF